MFLRHCVGLLVAIALFCLFFPVHLLSQTEVALLVGTVRDPQGGVIPGVEVQATRLETGIVTTSVTNEAGLYVFTGLQPGRYRLVAHKQGFKEAVVEELVLSVQAQREQNFSLAIGSASETVTVEASTLTINTQDASVSTVVDRQFAENLPLNGRSFQSLIELTPGVVVTSVNSEDSGQFSVNGQRAVSNYWTVDGVSANFGIGGIGSGTNNAPGNGLAGALGAASVLGGTNSLVSVDALEEFRIQTSTFAPDTGRTPGGQISIVTRSGTNQFHGSAFDYFRNTALDANNWFNGVNFANSTPLPKAPEKQNDFGGTFGGPILKDRTFFFFSYEGLRLRLPETTLSQVPDLEARQNATPGMQPYLNAFPFDPNQPDLGDGIAEFNASYVDPASLNAYSLRIDHKLNDKLTLFGRYNYSPSSLTSRALGGSTLNTITYAQDTVQTGTLGATWTLSPTISDDFRFNYSRANVITSAKLDNFGGAVPVPAPFPSPFTTQNADFSLDIYSLLNADINEGVGTHALQRQLALVDNLAVQTGKHRLAFGVDFRRLSPQVTQAQYFLLPFFADVPSAEIGDTSAAGIFVQSSVPTDLLIRNLSLFAQDTWQATPRLTLTYGLRWDVEFTPTAQTGPGIPGVVNYNNLSQLALAPPGTPPFYTRYGNVEPRIAAAYQFAQRNGAPATVLRAGFGVYNDLATTEIGNNLNEGYPYVGYNNIFQTFPVSPPPPPIVPPNAVNATALVAFDPHLESPRTLEWNVALEQALGSQQTLTISYVGAAGTNLLQTALINSPNPNLASAILIGSTGTSSYSALQAQFQRRLSRGLQLLASYTWSHSIDTGSSGSLASESNYPGPGGSANQNRGDSDFDIRNAFSAGVTYNIPAARLNRLTSAILGGWSVQSIIHAYSAPPISVYDTNFTMLVNRSVLIRPDRIPGIPLYLFGSQYPGGKILNDTVGAATCSDGSPSVGPFCPPPTDANGNPLRQGDLGRNSVRGYPFGQWDFGIHRDFPIRESLTLQFRAEMFNVLNHPNFGPPLGDISGNSGVFGYPNQTAGEAFSGQFAGYSTAGGLNTLYQIGGPRSIQLALKLSF
ncbi:MAG TPA: TonB-dependent receptor [Candidatus Acidoferrales bacterium]|nr:TonB-dependent receptor [Candidatus Acidoferrales bacterium]